MIDFDEIRKAVAIEHNVLLDKNDPSLMMVTMADHLLTQHVTTLNAQHDKNLKSLLAALEQGDKKAKETAGRVISQATDYACEQIKATTKAAMDEGREELRKDLRLAWSKIEAARKASYVAAGVSGICAMVTLGAMVMTVA
jgi:hypothetical protein